MRLLTLTALFVALSSGSTLRGDDKPKELDEKMQAKLVWDEDIIKLLPVRQAKEAWTPRHWPRKFLGVELDDKGFKAELLLDISGGEKEFDKRNKAVKDKYGITLREAYEIFKIRRQELFVPDLDSATLIMANGGADREKLLRRIDYRNPEPPAAVKTPKPKD